MEKTSFSAYDSSEQFNGASDVCFSAISCNVYVPWISANIRIIRCDPINTRTLHEFFFYSLSTLSLFHFSSSLTFFMLSNRKTQLFVLDQSVPVVNGCMLLRESNYLSEAGEKKKTQKHVTRRRSVFFPLRSEIPTHQTTKVINLNTFAN